MLNIKEHTYTHTAVLYIYKTLRALQYGTIYPTQTVHHTGIHPKRPRMAAEARVEGAACLMDRGAFEPKEAQEARDLKDPKKVEKPSRAGP